MKHNHNNKQCHLTQYCIECRKWICSECIQLHQVETSFHSHTLVPRPLSIKQNCPIHTASTLEYYCYTCEKAICDECKQNSHSTHSYDAKLKLREIISELKSQSNCIYEEKKKI